MKTKYFFAIVLMVITLSSCQKTDDGTVANGPSPAVLDKGTGVSPSIPYYNETVQFVADMDSIRRISGIPAYYDNRLLDLDPQATHNDYYVGMYSRKVFPVIMTEEGTITSVDEWFTRTLQEVNEILPDADSSYAGDCSKYTGRFGKWKRFNPYDLYAVRITPGTGCQVGKYKMELIVLIFVNKNCYE